jgi:hypothetical protein
MDLSERIGRRLKLQDLYVLTIVAQVGNILGTEALSL